MYKPFSYLNPLYFQPQNFYQHIYRSFCQRVKKIFFASPAFLQLALFLIF